MHVRPSAAARQREPWVSGGCAARVPRVGAAVVRLPQAQAIRPPLAGHAPRRRGRPHRRHRLHGHGAPNHSTE
eukprot:4378618-Prymnesium_polylepis.1